MKLTFYGAARQVTGSMYLLELEDEYRILIDCGSDLQRERTTDITLQAAEGYGSTFPFEPSFINLVLLTHAHIDHSGQLPTLIREGYDGQILCTAPTADLSDVLLMDSASLNRRKLAKIHGSKKTKTHGIKNREVLDLYTERHVEETAERFVPLAYKQRFKVKKGLWVTFLQAGHLLGAASILVEVEENGEMKRIGFSGDLGRFDYPLLPDPEPFPEVDYVITESTYGNRHHESKGEPIEILNEIIYSACIEKPGRLIIPAFSVGRTQALLYTLNRLYYEYDMPAIKVFADSPLAVQSTKVFERYTNHLNKEAQTFKASNGELFDFANLHYVENLKESQDVSNYMEPCIIISSSGMISGGRVEHHVRMNISNPYATILQVGYSAEGTIGHELMLGKGTIRIGDKERAVLATVDKTDIFSGHADLQGLLNWIGQQDKAKLKQVFLTHGDEPSMVAYAQTLSEQGYQRVTVPSKGDSFEL